MQSFILAACATVLSSQKSIILCVQHCSPASNRFGGVEGEWEMIRVGGHFRSVCGPSLIIGRRSDCLWKIIPKQITIGIFQLSEQQRQ